MYESFMIVLSAGILGSAVGFIVQLTVSMQFLTYLTFKMTLFFPWITVAILLAMSCLTTYLSVSIPITQIQKKRIS